MGIFEYHAIMDKLKDELSYECGYEISDSLFATILGASAEVNLRKGDVLYCQQKVNRDVYILKEGILRLKFFDGEKERTHAFALPATVMISYHSYFMGLPSYIQVEACTETTLLKITKSDFDALILQSHEFAIWVAYFNISQLFYYEKKLSVIKGTAKERYLALVENRPEIIRHVASKIVASYLGITPQYLSNIKRAYYKKLRNK